LGWRQWILRRVFTMKRTVVAVLVLAAVAALAFSFFFGEFGFYIALLVAIMVLAGVGAIYQSTRTAGRPNRRSVIILLSVLWVVALYLAYGYGMDAIDRVVRVVAGQLEEAVWVLPLAVAVSVTVLISPRARHWWPQPIRRVLLGLIFTVGFYGLTAAFGLGGALLALCLAAIAGLLAAWVLILPRRLAPPLAVETLAGLEDRDQLELADARMKLQNDVRTTALQAIAGLAILAGAVLAFQQLTDDRQQSTAARELTLQGQASERFTRAVDQLGSELTEVQLGGIYGLEQIAQQAPNNHRAVTEVLVAYLHRRSPLPAEPTTQPVEQLRVQAPDVQAALTVLVRRAPPPTDPPPELGLRGLFTTDPPMDLSRLDLSGAEISGEIILAGPDRSTFDGRAGSIQNADLRGTDLRGATFEYLIMSDADLRDADLRGADFSSLALPTGGISPDQPTYVESVDFRGALADGTTKWHDDDFDWEAAGIKMERK
jgi:Pentapeptide repeats (8 copies)